MRSRVQTEQPPLPRINAASRARVAANGFLLPPVTPPVCGVLLLNPPRPRVFLPSALIGTPRSAVTFAPLTARDVAPEASATGLRASVHQVGDLATSALRRQRINHTLYGTGLCPPPAHAGLLPPARRMPSGPIAATNLPFRLQLNLRSRPTGRWA